MTNKNLESAIKLATKEYRNQTSIGKSIPLTILRAIYRNAFLDGSRWAMEAIGVGLPPKKTATKRERKAR